MRVAVIGSGISGCSAVRELSPWCDITVFEAEDRLGGHTHTQTVETEGVRFPVDTGFIVFNHRTYPGLTPWFASLGVDTTPSDMSFSASLDNGALEWCGSDLNGVFAQRKNLLSPRFMGMLLDILRFNREAPVDAARLKHMIGGGPSLGEYLDRKGYRGLFLDAYLLPMAGAIWSCPVEQMREFPMVTFTRFCENHGLLNIRHRPQWYTVNGGSHTYIHRLQEVLRSEGRQVSWRTGHRVRQVQPAPVSAPGDTVSQPVIVRGDRSGGQAGFEERFDAVIVACHSDQACAMLPAELPGRALLGRIRYQDNTAILHTDRTLMPHRRSAWAAWNYIHDRGRNDGGSGVSVTYWMNRLQPLPVSTPVLVSLNPCRRPAEDRIINTMHYAHPVFDGPAIAAQKELPHAQGIGKVWFAGAWSRYGFHEDGFQAGVNGARALASVLRKSEHAAELQRAA